MNHCHVAPLLLALALSCLATTFAQCGGNATAQDPVPATQVPAGERIRLLVSGAMLGRLEPCGCASGQLGGLPRRMQHIGEQTVDGQCNYDLLLEGGDMVEAATVLDTQKAFTALQVLFGMTRPYDALGVGKNDLALPLAEWCSYAAMANNSAGEPPRGVVSSDLECKLPEWPGKPFVEKDVRGKKVRIASFTLQLPEVLQNPDAPVTLLEPTVAWQRALQGADPATLRVLMFHGSDVLARKVVPTLLPKPDVVLCFDHGYTEPPVAPELVSGVPVVYPGIRGRVLLDLSLARLPEGPRAGYEIVMLQGSQTIPGGGGDPQVKDMLKGHREQVKADRVLTAMARQLPTANGAAYIGSDNCKSCHPIAYDLWKASKHAKAWETLVKAEADPTRYGWPVTAYPDCVSCHVVGYREQTGFVTAEETPLLVDVGCERCHGAGSDHMSSPTTKPMGKVGGGTPSMVCTKCHDFEQSPNFLYGDKWPLIQHGREPYQQKLAPQKPAK